LESTIFGGVRDKLLIGVFGLLWMGMVVYSNYTDMFSPPQKIEPIL
jgi:hypothetical protein